MKNIKKRVVVLMLTIFAAANVLTVQAGNTVQYGHVYITKLGDFISGGQYKEEQSAASNLVGEVEGGRSLCSWIIDSNGDRMTDKPSYNNDDNIYMNYQNQVLAQYQTVRITISTTLTNFTETRTWGYWNPDYVTYVE